MTERTLIEGARCLQCDDVIYSRSIHDFHYCSCGSVGVDGGFSSKIIMGNREDYEPAAFFIEASEKDILNDWSSRTDRFGRIPLEDQKSIHFLNVGELERALEDMEESKLDEEVGTISLVQKVRYQDLCTLLVDAFDGSYTARWLHCSSVEMPEDPDWSWCTKEEREDWEKVRKIYVAAMCGGRVVFYDFVDEDKEYVEDCEKPLILDKKSMIDGIHLMAEQRPKLFRKFLDKNTDAVVGDVFVQCCLHEEIPY